MENGFIKLHRCLKEWEWYNDSKTLHLFIHLLLSVNWKDKKWQGVEVKRGSLITSIESLSNETGLSKQEVRTRLTRLEKTGEINTRTNTRFTLVSVCKFEDYQKKEEEDNTPSNKPTTNDQQTDNNQSTTTEEGKEIKEGEEGDFAPRESIEILSERMRDFVPSPEGKKEYERNMIAVNIYRKYCEIYGKGSYCNIPAIEWKEKVFKIPCDEKHLIPNALDNARKYNTFGFPKAAKIDYLINNWGEFSADIIRAKRNAK